jgi:NAD(P)-dependent dehydrogenase (short-subunit alcohol dehydrogenase family)
MSAGTNHFDLSGKVALITGGAGLLGPRHAQALALSGARVVISDLDLERARTAAYSLVREFGEPRLSAAAMDVTDAASIRRLHAELNDSHGGVDILVNNAAIDPKMTGGAGLIESSRFEHFPLDQWNFQLNVGLTGAFLCSQVFGTDMARRGAGVILNIASDLSVIAPDQRLYRKDGLPDDLQPVKPVSYSVIKTALIGLTRYLAAYWADRGVRVNALSPGGVYAGQPAEFVTKLSKLIPLGRMAQANEYQAAVQFLCSDASKYMTGQNLVIDGGRSVL